MGGDELTAILPARWRRPAVAATALLAVDQASKTVAQVTLDGVRIEPVTGWGLTYIVNPGTWLWPDASARALAVAYLAAIGVWVGWMAAVGWYARFYRRSGAVDLATGFFTLAVFGNLLDRLWVGGARDWAITPIATGNLADVAAWVAVGLLAWELWRYPPARRLLSLRPSRWRPDGS